MSDILTGLANSPAFQHALEELILAVLPLLAAYATYLLRRELHLKPSEETLLGALARTAVLAAEQRGATSDWTSEQKLQQASDFIEARAAAKGVTLAPQTTRNFIEAAVRELKVAGQEAPSTPAPTAPAPAPSTPPPAVPVAVVPAAPPETPDAR